MAFDYSTNPTGFFRQAGQFVKASNAHVTQATTTLPAELKAVADPVEAADYTDAIEGLYSLYGGLQNAETGTRAQLAAFVTRLLQRRDSVVTQLGVQSGSLAEVLPALIRTMKADAQTVLRCTATVGSVTAGGANVGNGQVLVSKTLDGFSPPVRGAAAVTDYAGLASEFCVAETMTVRCARDSYRDGVTAGEEQFSWEGGIAGPAFDWRSEGSGRGPTLTGSPRGALVDNGDFETWSSNTPGSWTLTGSTRITKESTNVYRGTYAAKLAGDGATATIGVEQTPAAGVLKARRMVLVTCRLKASAVPAAGQIELNWSGTGYSKTAPTPEVQTLQISGTPGAGSYAIGHVGPFGGTQTTAPIAYTATSATVQAALRLLKGLECVVVTTSAGSPPNVTHTITFYGVPGPLNLITCDISLLTGGAPARTIARTTAGVEGDCVVLPAAAFPTGWYLAYFWCVLPATLPSDMKLVGRVTSTLSNAVSLYVDDFLPVEVDYHGGVAAKAVPGSTPFAVNDTFTWTLSQTAAKFQDFFRRAYRVILPSAAGGNTIDEALAT